MRQQGGMTPSAKLMAAAALLVMLVAVFAIVPTRAAILSQLWGLNQVYFAEFQRKLAARAAPDLDEPFFKASSVAEAPVPTASDGGGRYDGPISVSLDSKDAITYRAQRGAHVQTGGRAGIAGRPVDRGNLDALVTVAKKEISP